MTWLAQDIINAQLFPCSQNMYSNINTTQYCIQTSMYNQLPDNCNTNTLHHK